MPLKVNKVGKGKGKSPMTQKAAFIIRGNKFLYFLVNYLFKLLIIQRVE